MWMTESQSCSVPEHLLSWQTPGRNIIYNVLLGIKLGNWEETHKKLQVFSQFQSAVVKKKMTSWSSIVKTLEYQLIA